MRFGCWATAVLCAVCVGFSGIAAAISWQEAVTRLRAERDKATSCLSLVVEHGSDDDAARAAEHYEKARAHASAVIDHLTASLKGSPDPSHGGEADEKLHKMVEARRELCSAVEEVMPSTSGNKNIFIDVMEDTVAPALEAIRSLFIRSDASELERATIRTQLEAARWPEAEDVAS